MGKSLALHLENGEMNRNVLPKKEEAMEKKTEPQNLLLQIARDAIVCHLEDRISSKLEGLDAELLQRSGALVTLHKEGRLRGCVGQIVSDKLSYETVATAASAAMTCGPRFHKASLSEIPQLEIEISVLTSLQPLERIEDLEIGIHSLYIKDGERIGLLLPQVATAHNWDRTQFLQQACNKAKLPEEAWQDSEMYLFSSQAFEEET